jgi:hypothetical protein
MNYKKIYDDLCYGNKSRIIDGYTETHHIIPRCMGGTDDPSNLVKLTPEEHYIAHQLLVKIYPKNKSLVNAANLMASTRPSNKLYGWLRRRLAKVQRERQTGITNSQYGTKWIHNKDLKVSKKISKMDSIPHGWELGRKIDWDGKTCKNKNCDSKVFGNKKYCSEVCKKYFKAPHFEIIDNNIFEMEKMFVECGSINKVLESYGITNRKGNTYFSNILKSRGHKILRRRNTPL